MKKFLIIIAFGLTRVILCSAQNTAIFKVVSSEDNSIDGTTEIELSYIFFDSTSLSGNPQLSLKAGWSSSITNPSSKTYYYSETITLTINLTYPTANISFFPFTIPIKQLVTYPDTFYLETEARLYFTPYNTLEIWSIEDFINLPRNWISADDNFDTTRVFVSRFDVPQSDYMPT